MKSKWAILFVVSVSAVGCSSSAEDGVEPDADLEIRALVDQLASKNSPPTGGGWPKMTYPDDWDATTQEVVNAAETNLRQYGKVAFPILLEHLDDDRYSMTRSYSREVNLSVGRVCRNIIVDQVDVVGIRYKSRTGADGKSHGWPGFFSAHYDGDLDQWWQSNQAKTLRQMQVDTLKWRISQEEKIGFPTGEPSGKGYSGGYFEDGIGYPTNEPNWEGDREWQEDYMAELNQTLRDLSAIE